MTVIFCSVYFVLHIWYGIYCPVCFVQVPFVRYILSGMFCLGIFCPGIFACVYFVQVSFVLAPSKNIGTTWCVLATYLIIITMLAYLYCTAYIRTIMNESSSRRCDQRWIAESNVKSQFKKFGCLMRCCLTGC